jgi:hypothetical protein
VHGSQASLSAPTGVDRRRTRSSAARRRALSLASAALLVVPLAGCSLLGMSGGAAQRSASTASTAGPSEPPTDSTAVPPVLVPGGTAEENRPLFDAVASAAIAADPGADGRSIVDALAAAGFDKSAMEVTDDTTAIGRDADSVQFSVRASDGCIVGERSASGYESLIAPVLGTGRCLVGKTRAIDW